MASIGIMNPADEVALHDLETSVRPEACLAVGAQGTTKSDRGDEVFPVTFGPGDPEDPKNRSTKTKWAATLALSAQGFNRIMISTIMAPAIPTIAADLKMSTVDSTMALSAYVLATAFGPLVIGPLSEVYGEEEHYPHHQHLVSLPGTSSAGLPTRKAF